MLVSARTVRVKSSSKQLGRVSAAPETAPSAILCSAAAAAHLFIYFGRPLDLFSCEPCSWVLLGYSRHIMPLACVMNSFSLGLPSFQHVSNLLGHARHASIHLTYAGSL